MTLEDAIRWCQEHHIEISFRLSVEGSEIPVDLKTREVSSSANFLKVVQDMKRRHRKEIELHDEPVCKKRLEDLSFEGYNCTGRIRRLAKFLEVATIGELLNWAAGQPRGLRQITDYTNIGERTLEVLIKALKQEGVERVPKGFNDHWVITSGGKRRRPIMKSSNNHRM